MSGSQPLVSVVTPVYDGAASLARCVDSVLAQTYTNWDMTIVDNLSRDATPEIAAAYAARDPRIRVVRNEVFVPVVQNYNNAVRAISPDSLYCKVVAADDRLDPECLQKMVALAQVNPRVAIVGALGFGFDGKGVVWDGLPYPTTIFPGREVCRAFLLGGPYVFGTQTSVLYRADLVRSRAAFFDERTIHPDTEVCVEFLRDSDFGFVHQVLSEQGTHASSTTSYSRRMNSYAPHMLGMLQRYGDWYLTPQELQTRREEVLRVYYRYLARQLPRRREPQFWAFHRRALAELGLPLSRWRLASALASAVGDELLNPKRSIEWWLSRRARRQPGA